MLASHLQTHVEVKQMGGWGGGGGSVRGHRTFLMLFADTWTLWSKQSDAASFPLWLMSMSQEEFGKRGKEAIREIWDKVFSQMDLQSWGKLMQMLEMDPTPPKSGLEPHEEWTHTRTQTLTQGKRGQPHGNYLFYFKIILFYLIELFLRASVCCHAFKSSLLGP